jgi:ABC-type multidrug transport system ATPase subunit
VSASLGPNGDGKSTTIEMIETIRKPTSGTITLLTLQNAGVLAAFAAAGFLVGTVLTRLGE